jgi:hypothetical protein
MMCGVHGLWWVAGAVAGGVVLVAGIWAVLIWLANREAPWI